MTYRLEFPFPNAEARARIWDALLPKTVPTTGSIDIEALAERYALSGGLIKNTVFKAAFRAASQDRSLSMDDLERAASEESEKLSGHQFRAMVGFASA